MLDPTPSIAANATRAGNDGVLRDITRTYDAIELRWIQWIVGYTGDTQRAVLYWLLGNSIFIGGIIMGSGIVFFGWRRIRRLLRWRTYSPQKQFLHWLYKHMRGDDLFLERFRRSHTDLVHKTQKIIFGPDAPTSGQIRELQRDWKQALA